MVKYCSDCGNEIEAGFKFCSECGKKLMLRPTSCPNCGVKLKEKIKFCPECGTEISLPEEKTKPEMKVASKVTKPKTSRSFLSKFKRPGKKALVIISVICIVLVVAAAMILFNPFSNSNNNGGSASDGRTFSIIIEHNYDGDDDIVYYLKVGALRYGSGSDTLLDETQSFEIDEDSLNPNVLNSEYDITLYATIDNGASYRSDTALDVTEYATFVISGSDGIIEVDCTESQ